MYPDFCTKMLCVVKNFAFKTFDNIGNCKTYTLKFSGVISIFTHE